MRGERSSVVVLAEPNGAGKSTMAAELLGEVLGVAEFVDADVIARNLPRSGTAAMTAGRAMLRRLDELGASHRDFGFETTLASRSLARRIRRLTRAGYECHLVFLWLPSADLAVAGWQIACASAGMSWSRRFAAATAPACATSSLSIGL